MGELARLKEEVENLKREIVRHKGVLRMLNIGRMIFELKELKRHDKK